MISIWRFTSSDTLVQTVVLSVSVVESGTRVVELGSTPLVVPQFYGLSNAIDSSVLKIRTGLDLVCTVRLITTDTNVPGLGQLVKEEDSSQRKGMSRQYLYAVDLVERLLKYTQSKNWVVTV